MTEVELAVKEVGSISSSSNLNHEQAERAEHRRIMRKLDFHLLPLITILYLLSFLDRSNIGNAKVAGMSRDLDLVGLRYNVIAAVFYITYVLVEVPSNIMMKLIQPSIWSTCELQSLSSLRLDITLIQPAMMVAWGLVMTFMCFCQSYEGLVVARLFLGLAEGGLFPGISFYLCKWYRPRDLARRVAIFYSAATLSGAFSGLLAFAIEKMDGIAGLRGWQWIFCLEGIVTVLVAFGAFFAMHDYPETAKFLTDEERKYVIALLHDDSFGQATHFDRRFIWEAFSDYTTYCFGAIFLGIGTTISSVSLFLPTLINDMGYNANVAQLLTIPPFAVACLVTLGVGPLSDSLNLRGPFIIGGCLLSMAGYVILYNTELPAVGYFGAFLVAVGVFPTAPVTIGWVGGTFRGEVKKGVCLSIVVGIANLGGICAAFIYRNPPRFHIGHGTICGCLGLAILGSLFLMWNFRRLNKKAREGGSSNHEKEFVYTL